MAEFDRLRLRSVAAQRKHDDVAITLSGPPPDVLKESMDVALKEEAEFKKNYARKIFETLSENEPSLLRRRDKKVVEWSKAFGTDFESLSPELQASLVALIEEKGGQYRLLQ